jgi:hypothetical protein
LKLDDCATVSRFFGEGEELFIFRQPTFGGCA